MVKINKIYTRTGDDGSTGLVGGVRVQKDCKRVHAYGDLDELNAFIGQARTFADNAGISKLSSCLEIIQNEIFDIGAELASPPGADLSKMPVIAKHQVERLESWIDELTEGLPELKSFVLPGGSDLNASLHIARTVCRRCERVTLTLHRDEPVSEAIRHYLNRLSDLLFAMARYETKVSGHAEYLWKPGSSRTT